MRFSASQIATLAGAVSLALILGALGFQYLGDYQPCEMCHWQRWPHIAAATAGLGGGLLISAGILERRLSVPIAVLTILLIAISGGIGVYHAGVEWKFWPGPSACTSVYVPGQVVDFTHMGHVPMCDRAAWRLFGISMAGYNALVSLGVAAIAGLALSKRTA